MKALIVTDIQNDFCPGGALAVPEGDEIVPLVNALVEHFDHVILTQDWHPAGHLSFVSSHEGKEPFDTIEVSYGEQILWPDHCVQGTEGAEFHPDLQADRAELIIRKGYRPTIDSYSAFFENDNHTRTGLRGYLKDRGITELFLVGLATDFCVHWSAVDGRHLGFDVAVIEDAARGIDTRGSMEKARRHMVEAGVRLITSDEVLAQAAVN